MDDRLRELQQGIESLLKRRSRVLVAIDGPGASGKTTLADKLAEHFESAQTVHLDDFYLPDGEPGSGDPSVFYDRGRLLEQVLVPFNQGEPGRYQIYDWETRNLDGWQEFRSEGLVLVEGVSALHPDLLGYYDLTVWIEVPREIRLERARRRDECIKEWLEHWMQEERRYIETYNPSESADLQMDGTELQS